MSMEASCRPVDWKSRSEEDILSGMDFLSIFMNVAEDSMMAKHPITTYHPLLPSKDKMIQTTTIDNHLLEENEESIHTTMIPEEVGITEYQEEVTTISSETFYETTKYDSTENNLDTNNNQIKINVDSSINDKSDKPAGKINISASVIQSNSKRNQFNVDESIPITRNSEPTKVKRKSEDLLAIGANPDYIAQQNARLNREQISYNHPYLNRNPTSRERSVSYSTVIQVLPPNDNVKSWKQEDQLNQQDQQQKLDDYHDDYDYTENYPPSIVQNKNSSMSKNTRVSSTAESKDYFVTRKYNQDDFNDSSDKQSSQNIEAKKYYEHQERNWGIPEKNYGTTSRNWGIPDSQQNPSNSYNNHPPSKLVNSDGNKQELSSQKAYHTTERNWGLPEKVYGVPESPSRTSRPSGAGGMNYHRPEQNYEVDESVSVMTNGRTHGVQAPLGKVTEKPLQFKVGQAPAKPDDNQKVGYVVEGRNYRKYRVEERTPDGFIVGEYGVVSNNDGSLRGVRYTADGTINPRVIYDALMKFLAL